MLKLLQINITANWGSTGKIAEQIGIVSQTHGWNSYLAYGEVCNPSQNKLIRIGNDMNRYFHFAVQRIFDNEGLCSRLETKKLIRLIEEIKPNIINLHNVHDHYLNYKILFDYLNKTDINVVWTFHDCWAFTGHCFHFVTKQCERWKTGCYNCPLRHEYPNTLLDRSRENYKLKKQLFGGAPNLTIVTCSDWMCALVKQSFLKDKQIKVIKNGVDINVFNITKPKASSFDGKFRILAVSSIWNQEKGYYDILALRKHLSDDFVITIVGLTRTQIKKLPSGINGIEMIKNVHELVDLYSSSDVLINPTYADTFPTVNIEALACGTPVITYNTGGSPESVDEATGVVVKQGDLISLASAIRKMKDTPLSSSACRTRAEQYFDKEKCFQKYIDLYESLF